MGEDDLAEAHEINVTPFIDVMLVLLIIFMVAAPLATVDVNVDLPVSNAPAARRPDAPVWLSVGPDLSLSLGNDPVAPEALAAALDAAAGGDHEARIFLRADKAVAYGDLMAVMNTLRAAGYLRIALVALDPSSAPPGVVPSAGVSAAAVPPAAAPGGAPVPPAAAPAALAPAGAVPPAAAAPVAPAAQP